jgi:hypothetical protein
LPERFREGSSGLHSIAHRSERALEEGIALAFDHEIHALGEGQPGFEQGREFLSEELEALRLHPRRGQAEVGTRLAMREKEQALTLEIGLEGFLVRSLKAAFDDLAAGVPTLQMYSISYWNVECSSRGWLPLRRVPRTLSARTFRHPQEG